MATDISVTALDMAYENDVLHEGRVEFIQSNLLRDLVIDPHAAEFDVLVANLPYVNQSGTGWIGGLWILNLKRRFMQKVKAEFQCIEDCFGNYDEKRKVDGF